jgi:hypothetical protein
MGFSFKPAHPGSPILEGGRAPSSPIGLPAGTAWCPRGQTYPVRTGFTYTSEVTREPPDHRRTAALALKIRVREAG